MSLAEAKIGGFVKGVRNMIIFLAIIILLIVVGVVIIKIYGGGMI